MQSWISAQSNEHKKSVLGSCGLWQSEAAQQHDGLPSVLSSRNAPKFPPFRQPGHASGYGQLPLEPKPSPSKALEDSAVILISMGFFLVVRFGVAWKVGA
eukprot:300757-Amphidinium_carterae.1